MAIIEYKGIKQNSSIEKKLTDDEFRQIAVDYYKKPDFAEVRRQLRLIHVGGGTSMNMVYEYYLKPVMSKAIGAGASWSIDDGLHYKPIMEYFAGKVEVNKKVFPDTWTLAKKIETAFRLCGIRYCVKLPNYPIQSVDYILKKYRPANNNYYDYSCGWAARMLGSLHGNVNYYGTDPNYELVDVLNTISRDYKDINTSSTSSVNIKCQGSEVYIPEWEGKMGLCFSSPPYYSLEDYQIGEQSYKRGVTYQEWLENYMTPTIRNIYRYLTHDGYFAINIKDFGDYTLEEDVKDIAKEVGFFLYETESLNNIKRCHGDVKSARGDKGVSFNDNDEKIYIFTKWDMPKRPHNVEAIQLTFF